MDEPRTGNSDRAQIDVRIRSQIQQRDRIVASYAVLAATGRLSARQLGLAVTDYDPNSHFHQVKDGWGEILTRDGQ